MLLATKGRRRYDLEQPVDIYGDFHALAALTRHPLGKEIDQLFLKVLEEEGYFAAWTTFLAESGEAVLRVADTVQQDVDSGRLTNRDDITALLRFYQETLAAAPQQHEHRKHEAAVWRELHSKTGFVTLGAMAELYERIRDYHTRSTEAVQNAVAVVERVLAETSPARQ